MQTVLAKRLLFQIRCIAKLLLKTSKSVAKNMTATTTTAVICAAVEGTAGFNGGGDDDDDGDDDDGSSRRSGKKMRRSRRRRRRRGRSRPDREMRCGSFMACCYQRCCEGCSGFTTRLCVRVRKVCGSLNVAPTCSSALYCAFSDTVPDQPVSYFRMLYCERSNHVLLERGIKPLQHPILNGDVSLTTLRLGDSALGHCATSHSNPLR